MKNFHVTIAFRTEKGLCEEMTYRVGMPTWHEAVLDAMNISFRKLNREFTTHDGQLIGRVTKLEVIEA